MFTKNDTFEQIMNTEPVKRAIGNLFPTCWLERIDAKHYSHTMRQIEAEVQMEWGVPFLSDAFVESANLLMETSVNHRFLFLPLWNPEMCPIASPDSADNCPTSSGNWIPDADRNCADTVWLFTGHPDHDATAFAHTAASASVPPYPSKAVPLEERTGNSIRPAVIICPGGGYEMLSTYSEGIQLAQRLERDGGYKAFILSYRITPNYYPLPQMDLALAVLHVRAFASRYQIDPNRILITGSSAGGHLCASEAFLQESLKTLVLTELASRSATPDILKKYEACSARPDGVGLLYPVISFLSEYHQGSYCNLTGQQEGLREALSVETHITSDYPPVYAFANEDDGCVPASNTKRLEEALVKADVAHLCQIFPTGDHGVGLGYDCSCSTWSEQMLAFFHQELQTAAGTYK